MATPRNPHELASALESLIGSDLLSRQLSRLLTQLGNPRVPIGERRLELGDPVLQSRTTRCIRIAANRHMKRRPRSDTRVDHPRSENRRG